MPRHERTRRKRIRPGARLKAFVFFAVLMVGMVIAIIPGLRPTTSEREKRDLAAFPKFSFGALFSGEYFRGIDDWYADTFPGRDGLMGLDRWVKSLYGIKTVEITGDIGPTDDIPDAPFVR